MSEKEIACITVGPNPSDDCFAHLFNLDKITKPNCKLCTSEHREFAETLYESQDRKNYSQIQAELLSRYEFSVSVPAIKNHLIYHYKTRKDNELLEDYAMDLKRWVVIQKDKTGSMRNRIAIMEKEIYALGRICEELPLEERRKTDETIKKLAETVLLYENKLREFQKDNDPVHLVFNQLKIIIDDELQRVDSVKSQQVITSILGRLEEVVGAIEI